MYFQVKKYFKKQPLSYSRILILIFYIVKKKLHIYIKENKMSCLCFVIKKIIENLY